MVGAPTDSSRSLFQFTKRIIRSGDADKCGLECLLIQINRLGPGLNLVLGALAVAEIFEHHVGRRTVYPDAIGKYRASR